MSTQNETYIAQKLQSFFSSSTTNKLHKTPQVDLLPFGGTLFSPFLQQKHSSQSEKAPHQQQTSTKKQPNPFYYINIIKYLGPYFTNKQKLFRFYCVKDQRMKIVDGGYFIDVIFKGLEEEWKQYDNQKEQEGYINVENIRRPLRDILQYYLGENEQRSTNEMVDYDQNGENANMTQTDRKGGKNYLENIKLTINRVLSLPQLWLNSKMSTTSQPSQSAFSKAQFPQLYIKQKFILSILTVKYLCRQLFSDEESEKRDLKEILLYVLNKILLQTSFVSEINLTQLNGLNSSQHHNFSQVWYHILFEIESSRERVDYRELVQIKKEFHQFLINNFDSLVKKQKLIELLFYLWVSRTNSTIIKSQISNNSIQQTPKSRKIKQFLLHLLNKNPHFKKQLYYIVQSSSQVSQTYLKPSYYLHFYSLINQIDLQNPQKPSTECQQSYRDYVFKQLSFWWSINKDFILTPNACYFRYNLLAYLVEKSNSEYLQTYENGSVLTWLSQGIQARIVDSKYYSSAILIWSKLAQVLRIEIDKNVFKTAAYFENLEVKREQVKKQQNIKQQQETYSGPKNEQNIHTVKTNSKQHSIQILSPIQQKAQTQFEKDVQLHQTETEIIDQNLDEQQPDYFQDNSSDMFEVKLKPPQTLQDCILALQNPIRRQVGFKQLQKLLITQQQDVIFVWKSLIKVLMHPLEQQSKECLKKLFIIRPKEWIQDVGELYFKKDLGLNEKIIFIETIQEGINDLAENPHKLTPIEDDSSQQFYFKRVSSRYYTQKPMITETPKDPQRTRRWGHTRIAHEKKTNTLLTSSSAASSNPLLIVNNNTPYINRLYEVVSQLFFKIVIKLTDNIDKCVSKQPLYAQRVLNLLSTVAENLKNYFEKYLILEDIAATCLKVLLAIEKLMNSQKKEGLIFNFQPKWDKKALSQLVMACIQTLNKVALSMDKFAPELMMLDLKECVLKLKKIDIYSIRPLVQMVEANIYKNTTGSINFFPIH